MLGLPSWPITTQNIHERQNKREEKTTDRTRNYNPFFQRILLKSTKPYLSLPFETSDRLIKKKQNEVSKTQSLA